MKPSTKKKRERAAFDASQWDSKHYLGIMFQCGKRHAVGVRLFAPGDPLAAYAERPATLIKIDRMKGTIRFLDGFEVELPVVRIIQFQYRHSPDLYSGCGHPLVKYHVPIPWVPKRSDKLTDFELSELKKKQLLEAAVRAEDGQDTEMATQPPKVAASAPTVRRYSRY